MILLVIILTEIWTIILNKWRSSKIPFFRKKEILCEPLDGNDVSFLQLHFLYSLHLLLQKDSLEVFIRFTDFFVLYSSVLHPSRQDLR